MGISLRPTNLEDTLFLKQFCPVQLSLKWFRSERVNCGSVEGQIGHWPVTFSWSRPEYARDQSYSSNQLLNEFLILYQMSYPSSG